MATSPDASLRARRLASELARQRRSLERVAVEVAEARALLSGRGPTSLELRGVGTLLHDFYTGAEKVFELVATTLDGGAPEGASWHRRTLESMSLAIPSVRPAVLRPETATALDEFLRFRHLFRNIYGFEIAWERIAELLDRVAAVHAALDADIAAFERFLIAVASP